MKRNRALIPPNSSPFNPLLFWSGRHRSAAPASPISHTNPLGRHIWVSRLALRVRDIRDWGMSLLLWHCVCGLGRNWGSDLSQQQGEEEGIKIYLEARFEGEGSTHGLIDWLIIWLILHRERLEILGLWVLLVGEGGIKLTGNIWMHAYMDW